MSEPEIGSTGWDRACAIADAARLLRWEVAVLLVGDDPEGNGWEPFAVIQETRRVYLETFVYWRRPVLNKP